MLQAEQVQPAPPPDRPPVQDPPRALKAALAQPQPAVPLSMNAKAAKAQHVQANKVAHAKTTLPRTTAVLLAQARNMCARNRIRQARARRLRVPTPDLLLQAATTEAARPTAAATTAAAHLLEVPRRAAVEVQAQAAVTAQAVVAVARVAATAQEEAVRAAAEDDKKIENPPTDSRKRLPLQSNRKVVFFMP